MNISEYDYPLPEERIARFPATERDSSRLLVWRGGRISESRFADIGSVLPEGSLLIFNNTRVVRARIVMHKPSGARIEVLCLEPHSPADHERAFAVQGSCEWRCMVGNLKKWKEGTLEITFRHQNADYKLLAWRGERLGQEQIVRFEWDAPLTFGQLLELLGRMPIPPYLGRDSEEIDNTRYQTVYAKFEGSVAAPTAGLHFTTELIEKLKIQDTDFDEVTLHVGAGTFLPVKEADALAHPMHTEHFEVTLATIRHLIEKFDHIIAVGTTSVRTLESLVGLAHRIAQTGEPQTDKPVGQFELYDIPASFGGKEALQTLVDYMTARGMTAIKAVTQIMITPAGFRYRITSGMVTNFHQPKSTLLLLVSAFVGGDWQPIYDYALSHNFRFLSYGDSSILLK
ncbi:MAG: S-adenosylmethionine:tRNA ribosyltransferase-isomerase [Rikenellaceae bacterium]|nr:S-adenosylmethionine:tRNA ribosyltransferase-isomerase [Rikenellaceae bacterium]